MLLKVFHLYFECRLCILQCIMLDQTVYQALVLQLFTVRVNSHPFIFLAFFNVILHMLSQFLIGQTILAAMDATSDTLIGDNTRLSTTTFVNQNECLDNFTFTAAMALSPYYHHQYCRLLISITTIKKVVDLFGPSPSESKLYLYTKYRRETDLLMRPVSMHGDLIKW